MNRNTTSASITPARRSLLGWAAAAVLAGAFFHATRSQATEAAVVIPPPIADKAADAAASVDTAVFAGGCFWGVQGVFQHTRGVLQAVSGYAGGAKESATYRSVSSGQSGHAEAVKVSYDPRLVSYGQLLQIYFSVAHDPTQLNRQGPDRGTQYRSAIFTTTPAQNDVAAKYIAQLDAAKAYPARIVTQLTPLTAFYAAEAEHQDYATLHPESPYIATHDLPKIASLKTLFPASYRAEPVLVGAAKAAP